MQSFLTQQYGPGSYLTARNLSNGPSVEFLPMGDHFIKASQPVIEEDGVFCRKKILTGSASVSLKFYDGDLADPSSAYDGISIYGQVIKYPGSDVHTLPRELAHLEPILSLIAGHQYMHSAYARDKLCGIFYRSLPLRPDVKMVAEADWHTHKVLTPGYFTPEIHHMTEIAEDTIRLLPHLSPRLVQSEYLISDMFSTLSQSVPSEKPMELIERPASFNLTQPPENIWEAQPFEVVHGNSYTFHAAASPPREMRDGRLRTILGVIYVPTWQMEQAILAV